MRKFLKDIAESNIPNFLFMFVAIMLITVDNGISSVEGVAAAKKAGR